MQIICALEEGTRTHVHIVHHLSMLFCRHPKQLQNVEISLVSEITTTLCNFAIFQDICAISVLKILRNSFFIYFQQKENMFFSSLV